MHEKHICRVVYIVYRARIHVCISCERAARSTNAHSHSAWPYNRITVTFTIMWCSNREYATVAQYGRSKGWRWTVRFRHTYKDRKTIWYRPASRCHSVGALFGAAQTERGNAQKQFSVSGRAVMQNYFARGAIQNRTPSSHFTTSVKVPPIDSKDVKGS